MLDPDDPFGGTIALGTPFSGSYTFDSTTPDGDPSASGGSYTSSLGTLSITIGSNLFTAIDRLTISVANDVFGGNFYTVVAQNTTGPDTFELDLTLQDVDGTVVADALLPTDAPAFAAFDLISAFLDGLVAGNQVQIQGILRSLTCVAGCVPGGGTGAPVPVPSALALLGAGLAAGTSLRLTVRSL